MEKFKIVYDTGWGPGASFTSSRSEYEGKNLTAIQYEQCIEYLRSFLKAVSPPLSVKIF